MNGTSTYKLFKKPDLNNASLIICWNEDAGCLGMEVFNYLNNSLNVSLFCKIEPVDFFSMSGVVVENDVAKFPESSFYCSESDNLVILKSAVPRFEWHKFIDVMFEISQKICNVQTIYTIGSMVTVVPHTSPRVLMASVNRSTLKSQLNSYDISLNLDYETPPGQRPTMSSYIIWEAKQKDISGVSLWVPVPFYLVGVRDWRACYRIIDFLNLKLKLGINLDIITRSVADQNREIAITIDDNPEINEIIRKLETNIAITESESNKIAAIMEERLKRGEFF